MSTQDKPPGMPEEKPVDRAADKMRRKIQEATDELRALAAKDAEIAKLKTDIAALTKRTATYEAGIRAVVVLIDESHGVDGLHKNGDIATWSELRAGGKFESWLSAFDAAVEVMGNG